MENVLDLCKALEPPLTDSSKLIPPKGKSNILPYLATMILKREVIAYSQEEVGVACHLHLQLCLLLLHPTLAQSPLQVPLHLSNLALVHFSRINLIVLILYLFSGSASEGSGDIQRKI